MLWKRSAAMKIRSAAVAGMFYPKGADELAAMIDGFLSAAPSPAQHAKAVIAPHAGYIYSGPTAAFAYKALDAGKVQRVILLGPSHHMLFQGLALPDADAFETPLGEIPLDRASMQHLLALPFVKVLAEAHVAEHSLEVHLPFLQRLLARFILVPICVGNASSAEVAAALKSVWNGEETAIVISSDLSHYQRYDEAREIDGDTIRDVLDGNIPLRHDQACGATPINGLLEVAAGRKLSPELLDYRNSGDTAGDRVRVVGYASLAFHEQSS